MAGTKSEFCEDNRSMGNASEIVFAKTARRSPRSVLSVHAVRGGRREKLRPGSRATDGGGELRRLRAIAGERGPIRIFLISRES